MLPLPMMAALNLRVMKIPMSGAADVVAPYLADPCQQL
jgi:hypothetical protein